jgi:thiol-disulfide isomerase/thioredoxin
MKFASRCLILLPLALAPALATSIEGLHAGAPAPQFQLTSSSGKPLSLADLKGRIVLVNFWASWCGPCRKEMPLLEQLNRQYRSKGVTLVGVDVEPDSAAAIDWLKLTPVSFPILFDVDSKVSKLYQVEGMPNTVILDRQGNVRYIHRGYSTGAENEYMDQIRALIRE